MLINPYWYHAKVPVAFNSGSVVTGTAQIPALTAGQAVVLLTRNTDSNAIPPSVRSGYTDFGSTNNLSNRAFRVQGRLGPQSADNAALPGNSAVWVIFNNVGAFGQMAISTASATSSTAPPIPDLSGLVSDGTSAALAMFYAASVLTGVTSPYSFQAITTGNIGLFTGVNVSSITGENFTTGTSAAHLAFAIELCAA